MICRDYRSPVIEMLSPGWYRYPLNEGVYLHGELNWCIHNLNSPDIKPAFTEVPSNESSMHEDPCQQQIPD